MRRRSAYYSRNDSFSRSFNAEQAERDGRLPRTRAAAALGVSAPAFDAGCRAARYQSGEWHHVGKYANRVHYYDTNELRSSPEFLEGAAAHYKSAAKRAAMIAAAAQARVDAAAAEEAYRLQVRNAFRARLVSQRDCTRQVRRHDSRHAWLMRCQRIGAGLSGAPAFGDVAGLLAAEAAWRERCAVALDASRRFDAILEQHFRHAGDREYVGLGVRILIHGNVSPDAPERRTVNIYGMKRSFNLRLASAVSLLEHRIDA